MLILRALIIVGVLGTATYPLASQSDSPLMDGLRLHEYCALVSKISSDLSDRQALHMNECLYYVSGVLDGWGITEDLLCIPTNEGVTTGQIGLVVYQYLDQHPERLHLPASHLVIEAVSSGFPCSPKMLPK